MTYTELSQRVSRRVRSAVARKEWDTMGVGNQVSETTRKQIHVYEQVQALMEGQL